MNFEKAIQDSIERQTFLADVKEHAETLRLYQECNKRANWAETRCADLEKLLIRAMILLDNAAPNFYDEEESCVGDWFCERDKLVDEVGIIE
jgi:hypothetical protein